MAINFPDSPTNGQVATIGGKNYTYNSTKNTWTPTQVTEADLSTVGSTTVVATHDLLPSSPSAGDMALVSSVNKMYVYFLSGWWLMSSLQNASPSGITGNAAIYDLAADGTPTTVTLSSSDPEGFPIVWSHSVISGSLGGTTVTNVNNVFTITPSTTEADAGTFTLRFAASDGQGGESGSQSQFTLDFVFTVTNSRYTTLLATATGTSDNNNITDTSTNNHTITVNGDAHAGTFSPYRSGGYSMYFDGSDYVDLGNGNLAINTEDFTIETWVNVALGSNMSIANNSNWNSGNNTGWRVLITTAGLINLTASQGSWNSYPSIYASTNAIPSNEWAHVVICRASGVISSYINGIKDPTTVNYSASLNQTGGSSLSSYSLIGAYIADGSEYNNLTGYLSDFHFKLGSAKYTTTFSPPTERLTVESGTDVLLFNKPFLKDESTNAYTTSISGDPKIKPFSPYDYEEYDAADHGGSVYFDGSGDSLNTTATQIIPSTSFTVTAWVYFKDTTQNAVWGQGTSGHSGRCGVSLDNGTWYAQIGNVVIGQSTSPSINEWLFTDLQWDGSTLKFFVNGSLIGSASTSNSPTNSALYIGDLGSSWTTTYPLNGYVSDLKVVSGTPSGSSIVPTAPLSSSGTSLHIKGTDASIIDKSQGANLKLVGNTVGSTTQVKFASTKSMYFDGSGDYIQASLTEDTLPNEFTIEGWIYTSTVSGPKGIFGIDNTAFPSTDAGIAVFTRSSTYNYNYAFYCNGNQVNSTTPPTANSWQHFALVRNSSNLMSLYLDGGSIASDTISGTINGSIITVGGYYSSSFLWDGYIQDFRITKGLARYTANFTPPTASLEG